MATRRSATWNDEKLDTRSARRAARNERIVRDGFWNKLRRFAASLPFAEDLLTAYYCAFDQTTPFKVKAALLAALAYFVLPADFMPDVLPILGFTDDAAILATALRMVQVNIQPEHREAAQRAIARELKG
jgi:uncharacterized membrane protein YkvA (DUF1232 family)